MGQMETNDMTQFEIKPERYLRTHRDAIVVNFLIKYDENSPAKMQYINQNGETHRCLGESRNVYSYSTRTSEIGRPGPVSFPQLLSNVNSTVPCLDPDNCPSEEVSSSISCSGGTCIKTDVFHISQSQGCPPDKLTWFCPFLKETCLVPERAEWMKFHCFETCFCSENVVISDTQDQPYPVDGGWGQWGAWETTEPTTGQAKRSRVCDSPEVSHGGHPCS